MPLRFRTPLILLCGAAFGVGFVLACGDDSPADVDAAPVCDCPAAEPPLDGRIVQPIESTVTIGANTFAAQSNTCDGTLLSGGCTLQTPDPLITLSESGPSDTVPNVWFCRWNNPTATANVGIVRVICLMPAE